jgi:hypothetical protein
VFNALGIGKYRLIESLQDPLLLSLSNQIRLVDEPFTKWNKSQGTTLELGISFWE